MKEEKDLEKLIDEAGNDHLNDASNETYVEGDKLTDESYTDSADYTEGNFAADVDVKQDAAQDIRENENEISAAAPLEENEGTGAHASVRGAWSNGNNWGV